MANHSKTPLFGMVRKALSMALAANKANMSAEEIVQRTEEAVMSRRKFLENTGKTALVTDLISLTMKDSFGQEIVGGVISQKTAPRIAIIGGGMAGLSALHTLKKGGFDATIYEASGRSSGRIFSVQGAMGPGTWAEFGGEFIDTNHADMWALAKEFNLELIDYAQASEANLKPEAYFFKDKHYTVIDVVNEFMSFAPQLKKDQESLPDEINYQTKDPNVLKLDSMSLSDYLSSIGASDWIKRLLEVAYESEYGLSPQVQSSLNLLVLISPGTSNGRIEWFGESDERYKTRGGNQSIPDAVAQKYPANIELNRPLESLKMEGKTYFLTFKGVPTAVKADFVIMAIPFTKLRQVDLTLAMPQVKRDCIDKLGYGTNAKLMLGMKSHFWREQGYAGLVYSDNGVPNGWDNAQLQTAPTETAGLSILFGGKPGVDVGNDSAQSQKDIFLPKWEQIYKGATEHFNGKVARMHWPTYQYNLGSYICYSTGQYTSISGAEAMTIGNVHFAGEHCGAEFAGYMNGAAKSGREAATQIMEKVKK